MNGIYLDNMATTPCRPEVFDAMLPWFMEHFGNPLSLHRLGQEALAAVENARSQVAALVNAAADEIVFTGTGTESCNFAVKGIARAYAKKGRHMVISAIEHHAVFNPVKYLEKNGCEVTEVPVDPSGMVDPDDVAEAIRPDTVLVSVMLANNEIGTIQPLAEIGAITGQRGVLLHADGCAAVGNIPVNVAALGVDALSLSGHKFHGPKGAGALFLKKGTRITPLIHGGVQEYGRRAGADNVPAIVGLGKAAELAAAGMSERVSRITDLRDRLVRGILDNIDEVCYNGHPDARLPGHVNVAVNYVEGEALLLLLMHEGIMASSGSTCTSKALKASHVLTAIGLPEQACQGSLQLTLGDGNTDADIDRVIEALPRVVSRLRAMSPLYRKSAAKA